MDCLGEILCSCCAPIVYDICSTALQNILILCCPLGTENCCSYKVARRGFLLTNIILLIFAIIFMGVGGVSVGLGVSTILVIFN
jgi:hypothetical protein